MDTIVAMVDVAIRLSNAFSLVITGPWTKGRYVASVALQSRYMCRIWIAVNLTRREVKSAFLRLLRALEAGAECQRFHMSVSKGSSMSVRTRDAAA